ncbi:hypothetical protein AB0H34_36765, partial [Saccharopolyspora shandongensis]|uniref:hypothetical protein n=1 Tax=Saccharopolyspora shandongensis TaxID=418495 RepID=UPI0033D402C3
MRLLSRYGPLTVAAAVTSQDEKRSIESDERWRSFLEQPPREARESEMAVPRMVASALLRTTTPV